MKDFDFIELPKTVIPLINKFNPPERLVKHLKLVFDIANKLIEELKSEWPTLQLDDEAILFGASTHDIGKLVQTDELFHPGSKHEKAGKILLLENGFSEKLSRFTETHGNWKDEELTIEDLLVILADKIWKGKRIIELEEKIIKNFSTQLQIDFWDAYIKFDGISTKLSSEADKRILWQNL